MLSDCTVLEAGLAAALDRAGKILFPLSRLPETSEAKLRILATQAASPDQVRTRLLLALPLSQRIVASAAEMSWRNQGITGSNNIPLGKARHFGAEEEDGIIEERDLKRGRDPEPRSEADGPRRRKKRNRWGDASENKAAGLMGLPTAILSSMTSEQLEAYTLHLRIEEISQKLRIDDVVPADGDRYVSSICTSRVVDMEMFWQVRTLI